MSFIPRALPPAPRDTAYERPGRFTGKHIPVAVGHPTTTGLPSSQTVGARAHPCVPILPLVH
jgi:hypothetical protein